MAQLTTNTLRAPWRGKDKWISDGGPRGGGRLVARVTRDGVAMLFQYFAPPSAEFPEGRKRFFPLGPYDANGTRGLSLPKARDRAAELSALYRGGTMDLHGHFQRERDAEERARKAAQEATRREHEAAQRSTLRQLLDAYTGHLERQGKQSVRDVRSIFETHVYQVAPDLGGRKAAEVTSDEFVDLIGKLVEAGKGRTAAKLRSYLRAAYSLAIKSKSNASAPAALRSFGITLNPVASTAALPEFNKTRDRVLSAPEFGAYLKRVDAMAPGARKDALQLCALLGGQRPTQLLRIKATDVDLSASTVMLFDGKGKRLQPRRHSLPIGKDAAAILERLLDGGTPADAPLLRTGKGSGLSVPTLSQTVTEISKEMVEAKEAREPFQLRDVRRTAETMLASLKITSDVRAQIQSHGLGGVQARHYDRHSYALEKQQTLQKWARHLSALKNAKQADVVSIASGRTTREETASRD